MSVVDEDTSKLRVFSKEQAKQGSTGKEPSLLVRCALYYQVVKALVPGHGITDDDPERAVYLALRHISDLCELARSDEAGYFLSDGDVESIEEMARELAEEVREA